MIGMIDYSHIPILLVIGFAIFAGTLGAKVFQRLHFPQVLGYILIGVLIGQSGLKLIDAEAIKNLLSFNFFALGVIGFMIGGELHRDVFKKYGRQFFIILLSEGLGAFFLVSVLVTGVALLTGRSPAVALALGLVFGAIASATAPAATTNVLWEHKTRGILTTTVLAIVAMDDALALMLFAVASSIATKLIGHGGGGLASAIGRAAYELGGGAAVGITAALVLNFILRRVRDHDNALPFIIGALALITGLSNWLGVDIILAAMVLGATLANLAPRRSNPAFKIVERFAPPLYVLFFVVAGARLHIGGLSAWMWALTLPYIIGRSAGKMLGANLGARIAKAAPVLRKHLGLCLFSQAGVAVGLSILASTRFGGEIGTAIIMIVAVTTFVLEILGPACVKVAVKRAGEVGLDVTEEDLMNTYTVAEMTDKQAPAFAENARLGDILRTIAATDAMSYPVTDAAGKLTGIISLAQLKQTFATEGLSDWLVAFDLMGPVGDVVTEKTPLTEAVTKMKQQQLECLPVVTDPQEPRLVGLLELRRVNRRLSQEILRRRKLGSDGTD